MVKLEKIIKPSGEVNKEDEVNKEEVDKVEKMVESLLVSLNSSYNIGSGSVAEVYRADWEEREYCIKHKAHSSPKESYENNWEDEMLAQTLAFEIIEEEEENNNIPLAKVPSPEYYLKTTEKEELIIMEQIRGKTLYRIILEEIAKNVRQHIFQANLPGAYGPVDEEVLRLSEKDLERLVIDVELGAENARKSKNDWELQKYLFKKIEKKLEDTEILPKEIRIQIQNTLKLWRKNNFYHRDLHIKNIMISNDLKQAYFIDFGSSGQFRDSDEAYDQVIFGQKVIFFPDEGVLNYIDLLVKKD